MVRIRHEHQNGLYELSSLNSVNDWKITITNNSAWLLYFTTLILRITFSIALSHFYRCRFFFFIITESNSTVLNFSFTIISCHEVAKHAIKSHYKLSLHRHATSLTTFKWVTFQLKQTQIIIMYYERGTKRQKYPVWRHNAEVQRDHLHQAQGICDTRPVYC